MHEQQELTVTETGVAAVEKDYDPDYDFCTRKFKTQRGMRIHRSGCQYNYNTTETNYVVLYRLHFSRYSEKFSAHNNVIFSIILKKKLI